MPDKPPASKDLGIFWDDGNKHWIKLELYPDKLMAQIAKPSAKDPEKAGTWGNAFTVGKNKVMNLWSEYDSPGMMHIKWDGGKVLGWQGPTSLVSPGMGTAEFFAWDNLQYRHSNFNEFVADDPRYQGAKKLLNQEIQELEKKLDALNDKFSKGKIEENKYNQLHEEYCGQISENTARKVRLKEKMFHAMGYTESAVQIKEAFKKQLRALEQRELGLGPESGLSSVEELDLTAKKHLTTWEKSFKKQDEKIALKLIEKPPRRITVNVHDKNPYEITVYPQKIVTDKFSRAAIEKIARMMHEAGVKTVTPITTKPEHFDIIASVCAEYHLEVQGKFAAKKGGPPPSSPIPGATSAG